MLPVKILPFDSYYKQKIGRVIMKYIFKLFLCLFCFDAVAAVHNDIFAGTPSYLKDAANAWAGIFSEFGPGAQVASYITAAEKTDLSQYINAISILGFNNTSMALLEVNNHVNQSFNEINYPLVARRNNCTSNLTKCEYGRRTLVIDGQIFGSFSDYSGGDNGDFKTNNTGFVVNAKTYVTDGMLFGVEYTRSMIDTHDTRVYSDAIGNSITLFTQYLAKSGFFTNFGLNAGHISWNTDKLIGNVTYDGTYDTAFYAGQFNFGIRMLRGLVSMTPNFGVKYIFVDSDKYVDDVAQEFEDWWYNTMTVSAGVNIGFDFIGSDFVLRPSLNIGGGYDVISRGKNEMRVQLIDSQYYNIPIDAPQRAIFNSGIGIDFFNEYFTAGINYTFDMRSNYINNIIGAKLKIAF